MSESVSLSRRQFLTGCVGCAAALSTPAVAEMSAGRDRLSGTGGEISPEGRARIAAIDQRFEQQRGSMQQTVNVVDDWGLDPSGENIINNTLASKLSGLANTRVVFPGDGVFRVTDQIVARPSGPVEIIGNGCTIKLDSNSERRVLNLDRFPSGSLFRGFAFASTGDTALGFRVATEGTVRVENITVEGYMVSEQSNPNRVSGVFVPTALSPSATVQVRKFKAIGGGAAGSHDNKSLPESAPQNQLATPMGVWVGQSTEGTIQLIECQVRGWSNGLYGGRTPGRVEVAGGTWWNNLNAQNRLGGGSIVDGVTYILDDREWSMEENPGPFSLSETQGVHAIRVDAKHGNTSDPLRIRNVEIQAKSMQKGASVIEFETVSGPSIIENTKIMSYLERPIIRASSPAGGISQSNILVKNSLIGGNSAPTAVMEINGRPQSRITQTCIQLPNAGPDMISGAEIGTGVGFGQCKGSGLSNPSKVGSGGNISSLPAPNSTGVSAVSGPSKKEVRKNYQKWAMGALSSIVAAGLGFAMLLLGAFLAISKLLKG